MARNGTPDVHLALNVRGMTSSATVAINERSDALRRAGRKVYKLGLGQSPFPVPRVVVEALQNEAWRKDYLPVRGLAELREAIAGYHQRVTRIERTADDVLVGPGSKELMFLLQVVYYGDLVIPTPAWVSYAPQARIVGRQVRQVATRAEDGWRLGADALDALCSEDPGRPRIVVLNYPSNPTGLTLKADDLEDLARVARRHKLVVLSDEIYGELHHRGQHVSIARFYPEGTIVSGGLSKWCGAGGWRLGTFIFPDTLRWLLDAMAAVASETFTSTSAPIQYAAVRAFQGGLPIERYLWHCRRILGALGREAARRLRQVGAHVDLPEGGFYLFPDAGAQRGALAARGITTSEALCEALLEETGVAVLPGSVFGRPAQELTFRLAYVDFDGARALASAETRPRDEAIDLDFLGTYCEPVLEAVDLLAGWLADPRPR